MRAAVLVLKDGKPICEGYSGEGSVDHAMEPRGPTGMNAAAAARDDDASVPKGMVIARGAGDQRLIVIPSKGLTFARLATVAGLGAQGGPAWSDVEFVRFFID